MAGILPLMPLHVAGYGQRPNSWSDVSALRLFGKVPCRRAAPPPPSMMEMTRPEVSSHDTPAKLLHTSTEAFGARARPQSFVPDSGLDGAGNSPVPHMPPPGTQSPFQLVMLSATYRSRSTVQSTTLLKGAHPKARTVEPGGLAALANWLQVTPLHPAKH